MRFTSVTDKMRFTSVTVSLIVTLRLHYEINVQG